MATIAESAVNFPFLDMVDIQRVVVEQDALIGFVPNSEATTENAQTMATAFLKPYGIRTKGNLGSCGIIAAHKE